MKLKTYKKTTDGVECEFVEFGHYPQSADSGDATPIEWRVLEKSGGELLLMSESILDCVRYHGTEGRDNVQWQDSLIRAWLNNDFFNKAFGTLSKAEQDCIVTSSSTGNGVFWHSDSKVVCWQEDNWRENRYTYDADGCADTRDKVFLLNVEEARRYFGKDGEIQITRYDEDRSYPGTHFINSKRAAQATPFAQWQKSCNAEKLNKRLFVYQGNESGYGEELHCKLKRFTGNSRWWLRNRCRLHGMNLAWVVFEDGNITAHYVRRHDIGVRPCIRIQLGGMEEKINGL